jgi:hypothetical protein
MNSRQGHTTFACMALAILLSDRRPALLTSGKTSGQLALAETLTAGWLVNTAVGAVLVIYFTLFTGDDRVSLFLSRVHRQHDHAQREYGYDGKSESKSFEL